MGSGRIVSAIVMAVMIGGPFVFVVWGWAAWLRHSPKPLPYGAAWTVTAFAMASFSAFLNFSTALYAYRIGGFRYLL
jgi:hypothetical protein